MDAVPISAAQTPTVYAAFQDAAHATTNVDLYRALDPVVAPKGLSEMTIAMVRRVLPKAAVAQVGPLLDKLRDVFPRVQGLRQLSAKITPLFHGIIDQLAHGHLPNWIVPPDKGVGYVNQAVHGAGKVENVVYKVGERTVTWVLKMLPVVLKPIVDIAAKVLEKLTPVLSKTIAKALHTGVKAVVKIVLSAAALSDPACKTILRPRAGDQALLDAFAALPVYDYTYLDDDATPHVGAMADAMERHLGIGDGHTFYVPDYLGVLTLVLQALLAQLREADARLAAIEAR